MYISDVFDRCLQEARGSDGRTKFGLNKFNLHRDSYIRFKFTEQFIKLICYQKYFLNKREKKEPAPFLFYEMNSSKCNASYSEWGKGIT